MENSGSISSLSDKLSLLKDKITSSGNTSQKERQEILKLLEEIESCSQSIETQSNIDKKFQLIFEHAPVGVMQFDSNGVITACNDNFVKTLGSSRKRLIGLDMKRLPNKEVLQAVKQALDGKTGTYEGQYRSVTGNKTSWVKAVFSPVIDSQGKVIAGVGMVEDITERRKSEVALEESELRYRSVFRNNYSVMMVIDPKDGTIIDANEAAEKYYGWTRSEIRRKNIKEINTLPDDEIQKEMEKARDSKQNIFHFKHRRANGTIRDVEVYSGRILIKGKNYLYSIVHDVTARVKAMDNLKKFRLGIDRSPNAIFITDIDGSITYVNPAFEKLYGYSQNEVLGKNPRILNSGKQDDSFYRVFWKTILDGEVVRGTMINKTKDGTLVDIHFTSNPIINDENEIIGFIAIQTDITEFKKMEESLRESLYEKEIMLSEIHHRVKNNLAMISAMMLLQSEKTTNKELKNKLLDSTNRIKAIANIHEHLYESSNFSLIHFTDNLISLTEKIATILQTDTDISIESRCGNIRLDVNQAIYCSLIVNEVVTNIIKHAFDGKEKGDISICTKENDGSVILEISDNGHKLPENFQDGNTTSLGMDLIHIFSRQIDAKFKYIPKKSGSTFSLTFKKKERDSNRFQVQQKMPVKGI